MTLCRTLYGVAVPDYDYSIRRYKGDKVVWTCPYFQRWANMIARCYSSKQREYTPSYAGVTVCEDWLRFSNFKSWMEQQDWEGKELDKDLLGDGKFYSPETCCFISKRLNLKLRKFLYEGSVGVSWHKQREKYRAYTYNYRNGKQIYLGLFDTKEDACVVANEARSKELEMLLSSDVVPDFVEKAIRGRCIQPDGSINRSEAGKILKNKDYPKVELGDLV